METMTPEYWNEEVNSNTYIRLLNYDMGENLHFLFHRIVSNARIINI